MVDEKEPTLVFVTQTQILFVFFALLGFSEALPESRSKNKLKLRIFTILVIDRPQYKIQKIKNVQPFYHIIMGKYHKVIMFV